MTICTSIYFTCLPILFQKLKIYSISSQCCIGICVWESVELFLVHWVQDLLHNRRQSHTFFCERLVKVLGVQGMSLSREEILLNSIEVKNGKQKIVQLTTAGLKGGSNSRCSNFCQFIVLKKRWSAISPRGLRAEPNRILASFSNNLMRRNC